MTTGNEQNFVFALSMAAEMHSLTALTAAAEAEMYSMAANDRVTDTPYTEEAYIAVQKKIEAYAGRLSQLSMMLWERAQMMG